MGPMLTVGRYSLFGELASGGMATVHFGRMHSVGGFSKTVAIKRMRRDIGMDPEFVAMFLDEARLTSRIEHPNVVATVDVVAEAGEVFLVLEYVRGESLERLRRAARARREHIPVPVAVSILCGALAGLHAAHEAVGEDGRPLGIIHRDVSPQNILVGEDGIARISDFGIAKAESRLQVTQDGQMKGKLPYMAPEQLAGGARTDRRVDLFSAMTVLWELLAGRTLFRADHPGETIGRVLSAPIPSPCPIRPDVPPALDAAIRRGLSRSPDQRPPTAEALAELLEGSLGQGVASPRVVGAWVAGLAAEVLDARSRYVREMESVSQLDAGRGAVGQGWTPAPTGSSAAAGAAAGSQRLAPAGTHPFANAAAQQASPFLPNAEESSSSSGSIRSFGLPTMPVPADDRVQSSFRSVRSTRLALVLGTAAVVLAAAVILAIAAVLGGRSHEEANAAGGTTRGVTAPPSVLSAQASPLPLTAPSASAEPPSTQASGPQASASEVPLEPSTAQPASVKGPTPATARPPAVRPSPARPYLPDMP